MTYKLNSNKMKKIFVILILTFSYFKVLSQMQTSFLEPVASPQASVSQNVGMTNISMNYSSPGIKGRKIFGDLVPYNEIWRAGANGPTTIKFSTSVKINGETLRAGDYSIAMVPSEKGMWKIDFNKAGKYPFAYMKDGEIDMEAYNDDLALSIEIEPKYRETNVERLKYIIDANDNKVANVLMIWSNLTISFKVDTTPNEHIEKFKKRLN